MCITYIWAMTVVSAATLALFLLTEHGPRFLFFSRGCWCLGLIRLIFVLVWASRIFTIFLSRSYISLSSDPRLS